MLLPTTDEDPVPRERSQGQDPEDEGQADVDSIQSTIVCPENPSVDLVIVDDHAWCFFSETSKLASNTSSFSFVVNVDGIKDLSDEATSPLALGALANMMNEEPHEGLSDVHDEILQASLARTIFASARDFPVYRVSGSKTGSVRPQAKKKKKQGA